MLGRIGSICIVVYNPLSLKAKWNSRQEPNAGSEAKTMGKHYSLVFSVWVSQSAFLYHPVSITQEEHDPQCAVFSHKHQSRQCMKGLLRDNLMEEFLPIEFSIPRHLYL